MSINDPISDMIVRIRNGQNANKISVSMFSSKIKISIAKLLKDEGYILDFSIDEKKNSILKILLKYFNNKSVIEEIKKISKPSLRVYKNKNNLPYIIDGLGISIISTSKGIMTDKSARKLGIGGEVICYVL